MCPTAVCWKVSGKSAYWCVMPPGPHLEWLSGLIIEQINDGCWCWLVSLTLASIARKFLLTARTAGAARLRSWVGRKSRGKLYKWSLFCENWDGDRIKFLKLCSLKHQETFECNNSSASQWIWIFWKLRIPLNESKQWASIIVLQISKPVLFFVFFLRYLR